MVDFVQKTTCPVSKNTENFCPSLFLVSDCKALINWSNLDIVSTETAQIPDETAATYRTFIFAIVYLALYSTLIFTALFSLCGINNSCLGRRSFPIFFAPWIFVCCSIVVMDIIATTFYIMDSISTAVSFSQLICQLEE